MIVATLKEMRAAWGRQLRGSYADGGPAWSHWRSGTTTVLANSRNAIAGRWTKRSRSQNWVTSGLRSWLTAALPLWGRVRAHLNVSPIFGHCFVVNVGRPLRVIRHAGGHLVGCEREGAAQVNFAMPRTRATVAPPKHAFPLPGSHTVRIAIGLLDWGGR
jgi:hypothetical protein